MTTTRFVTFIDIINTTLMPIQISLVLTEIDV
jgi:hypothetical protein